MVLQFTSQDPVVLLHEWRKSSDKYSHIKFRCADAQVVVAHPAIVSLASPNFLAQTLNNLADDDNCFVIIINDFKASVVNSVLDLIYFKMLKCDSVVEINEVKELATLLGLNNVIIVPANDAIQESSLDYLSEESEFLVSPVTQKYTRRFRRHMSVEELTCKTCNKCFDLPYKLRLHEHIHSTEYQFICSYCAKGFNNKYKMQAHEKSKKCQQQNSKRLWSLENIISTSCHGNLREKSKIIKKKLDAEDKHSLRQKIEFQAEDKAWPCSQCSLTCSSLKTLRIHKKTVHKGVRMPFCCASCNRSFLKVTYLEEHVQRFHSAVKEFACMFCTKHFATKQDLKRHIASHRGELNFRCHYCPSSFVHRTSLTQHERAHLGSRPYKCWPCGRSFGLLGSLKKHQESHLRRNDNTRIITAPKGRRGCLTYIRGCNDEDEKEDYASITAKVIQEVYIPSGQYIKGTHAINQLHQMQVISSDYGDLTYPGEQVNLPGIVDSNFGNDSTVLVLPTVHEKPLRGNRICEDELSENNDVYEDVREIINNSECPISEGLFMTSSAGQ